MSKIRSRQRGAKLNKSKHYRIILGKKEITIPGKKLTDKEITFFRGENKYFCGYLRQPHLYFGKFTGLCALCDFGACDYLHIFNSLQNSCPVYQREVKEMEEYERERLEHETIYRQT